MPTARPFHSWHPRLKERGFSPASTGGRRGLYMTMDRAGIGTAVGTMLHERREGTFCVVLHISHPFPFADPPHEVILLTGDLTPDGVRIDEPGPPRPGSTTWWTVEDVERAWETVEIHGLPWLERLSRVDLLIEHFEREIEPRGFLEPLRHFFRPDEDVRGPRRKFLLWLALLHERSGDVEAARDFLHRYIQASRIQGRGKPDQLQRMDRHLAKLRGTGRIAEGMPRDEFLERFGGLWARIFVGGRVRDGAFTDDSWEQVLLPDPRSEAGPGLDAWLRVVGEVAGDPFCVLSEDESDVRHVVNVLVPPSREGVADAFTRTDLAQHYAFFTGFGPSGRWGLVFEENFACLAGDGAFMDACARIGGGSEGFRERFLRWADTEWATSDRHLATVLDRVGWH